MSSEFLRITRSRYDNMCRRAANWQVEVGFSLAEWRGWHSSLLGSDGGGVCRCHYCQKPISLKTLVADHKRPLSRGGEAKLENLEHTCAECNDAKGALNNAEFDSLLAMLDVVSEREHNTFAKENILRRLRKAEKLAKIHRDVMKKAGKRGKVIDFATIGSTWNNHDQELKETLYPYFTPDDAA
jgi:5-methylcytosine-specific restriction endonuclease McrA